MNKEIIKQNLRSKTFWIAAGAFVLLMLHTFGVNVVDAQYNQIFNAVLGLLTMLGILNAPQTDNTSDNVAKEIVAQTIDAVVNADTKEVKENIVTTQETTETK